VNADTLEVTLDVAVTAGSVILNEIMAAPATGQPEWIELLNTGDLPVDLFGYGILDSKATSPAVVQRHTFLSGGGYAILAADELPFSLPDEMPVIRTDGFPALNNDGDKVILLDYAGTVADSVSYAATEKGYSLERIDTGTGWDTCTDPSGATPGRLNSISFDAGGHVKSVTIDIDPNPFGYVTTVSYELPFPLARVSLTIYDRRGRQVATLRDGEESGSDWSCTWDGSSGGSRLPAGPYILNLEAIDKRTGRIVTERKVIVIGTKL